MENEPDNHPLYNGEPVSSDERALALRVATPAMRSEFIRGHAKAANLPWLRSALDTGCFDLYSEFKTAGELDVSPGCAKSVLRFMESARCLNALTPKSASGPQAMVWHLESSDPMRQFGRDLIAHVIERTDLLDESLWSVGQKASVKTTRGWMLALACSLNLKDSAADLLDRYPDCAQTWLPVNVLGESKVQCADTVQFVSPYFIATHFSRGLAMEAIEATNEPLNLMMVKDQKRGVLDPITALDVYSPYVLPQSLEQSLHAIRQAAQNRGKQIENPESQFDPIPMPTDQQLSQQAHKFLNNKNRVSPANDRSLVIAFLNLGAYGIEPATSLSLAVEHGHPTVVNAIDLGTIESEIKNGTLNNALDACLKRASQHAMAVHKDPEWQHLDALMALHVRAGHAGCEAELCKVFSENRVSGGGQCHAMMSLVMIGHPPLLVRHLDAGLDPQEPLANGKSLLQMAEDHALNKGQDNGVLNAIRSHMSRRLALACLDEMPQATRHASP